MTTPLTRNTIRTFALVCVALTSLFVMTMSVWTIWMVGSDWCGQVVGSAKYADGRPDFAIKGCVEVMRDQIAALANNSLVFGGVIALCLLALMLIVVAGGRLSFSAGAGGVSGSMSAQEAGDTVADAAREAADTIPPPGEVAAAPEMPVPEVSAGDMGNGLWGRIRKWIGL